MSKLLIFDLDGTLFDTFEDIYTALTYTLKKHSYPIPSIDDAKSFVGDGLKTFIARATGFENSSDFIPHNVLEDYLKYYDINYAVKTLPYVGIVECIKSLDAEGYFLAVLSNKSEFLCKKIIEHFGLTTYFHYIAGGDTFAEKKPSPLPILSILNLFQYDDIAETVMIGDSSNDILSAKSAKAKIIYCKYGYGKDIPLQPDFFVDNASEIYDIIVKKL